LLIAGISALSIVAIVGGLVLWTGTGSTPGPPGPEQPGDEAALPAQEAMPTGNPLEVAAEAIARGDFRLIITGSLFGPVLPNGVTCFTPGGTAPGIRAQYTYGDVVGPEVTEAERFAEQFNRQIVSASNYPFADICRISQPDDAKLDDAPRVDRSAREVARPVATLHEAARRGSAGDVRRLLGTFRHNIADEVGMTPLAWAAARGRSDIYDLLLAGGEVPRAFADYAGRDDLYWAIATGREAIVEKAFAAAPPGSEPLRPVFLEAALASGNVAVTIRVLAAPHEPLNPGMLRRQDLSAATVELLLKASDREVADRLLEASFNTYREIRTDLVKLALRYGANANAALGPRDGRYETPLYLTATGYGPSATEAMSILLAAKADPNVAAPDPRIYSKLPLWAIAEKLMQADDLAYRQQLEMRADMLIKAGARLDTLDSRERPLVWALLAPATWAQHRIEPGRRAPEVIAFFAARGMNVNARWEGQRVLSAVEAQLGKQSALALQLRELGAKT
jgi:hypothetical protein